MDLNKIKELYQKILNNSVGKEKRCSFKKIIKRVTLTITTAALVIAFINIVLVGGNNKVKDTHIDYESHYSEETKEKYNGYSTLDIINYSTFRSQELLEENNFTKYSIEKLKKKYDYTAEDYKKIEGLDESYLYGFYDLTTTETFNEILKALEYENLNDFLIKNGYVDKNGNPNTFVWCDANLEQISEIMKQQGERGRK